MSRILGPRPSGKYIAANADHVKILEKGIKKLGNELIYQVCAGLLKVDSFSQASLHPKAQDSKAVDWIFLVDTLNFCFWSKENQEGWRVDGYTGYFALCAAINRALVEKIDILNPAYYASITTEQAEKIFRSDNNVQIPLFEERIKCLHEVGTVLVQKCDGSFKTLINRADKCGIRLLELIIEHFPCYRDVATYKDKKVAMYKRAQILVGDIWACFKGKGLGEFFDITQMTMFADYRVPQSLMDFGVLEYDRELLDRLQKEEPLPNGDPMEVEIRGCSIHAVELVKEYVNCKMPAESTVNSITIDHFLWDYRRTNAKEILEKRLPFHKTYCIYY